ncbi:hypothetical protein EI217_19720 [Salmonella enterica]|nr:hypothetical protein [Salmonella enterica]
MFHTIVSIKNDGHYFCRAGGNRPDGLNEPVTHQAQFPHTPSGVQGAQVTARQGRRDRNGRCKPGFSRIGP